MFVADLGLEEFLGGKSRVRRPVQDRERRGRNGDRLDVRVRRNSYQFGAQKWCLPLPLVAQPDEAIGIGVGQWTDQDGI